VRVSDNPRLSHYADSRSCLADTFKNGTGGSAGMRPHELLEASLATCMTISARMALADLGLPGGEASVRVRVRLERKQLIFEPA
jgi:putative redox protein